MMTGGIVFSPPAQKLPQKFNRWALFYPTCHALVKGNIDDEMNRGKGKRGQGAIGRVGVVRGPGEAGRVLPCKVVPPPARGCLRRRRGACRAMLCQREPGMVQGAVLSMTACDRQPLRAAEGRS